jgi:signal transduction histidine kinase
VATVLHIEDDASNRLLVRKLLVAAGHDVVDAATGLDGVRLASTASPDLVLVDINIPHLDGYEVTLRLRGMADLRGVPIVAVTAEGDRQTSLAVGADGFIAKPIDAATFARTVERFLRGHRERPDETGEGRLRERAEKIVERLERKIGELTDANARLEELARLRREFLQNMSHELATPLTPVVGYLRLLLNEEFGALTPLQRRSLESVESSTNRLRELIDTLLDVSALENGQMHFYEREYDFGELAARVVDGQRARAREAQVTLEVEALPTGLEAKGDPDKLRRAMAHVLDNALKFSPRGKTVAVGVREQGKGRAASYAFVVADDGPGVAPDQVGRILQPFYQVDGTVTRKHGGVGLGLAFANRVAVAHAGGLEIQSPPVAAVAGCKLGGTAVALRVGRQLGPQPRAPRVDGTQR